MREFWLRRAHYTASVSTIKTSSLYSVVWAVSPGLQPRAGVAAWQSGGHHVVGQGLWCGRAWVIVWRGRGVREVHLEAGLTKGTFYREHDS